MEPQHIKDLITTPYHQPGPGLLMMAQKENLSGKCERCGCRPKYVDRSIASLDPADRVRKWCKRCFDVVNRARNITEEIAERKILKLVGSLYLDAALEHITEEGIRMKLHTLEAWRDVFFFGAVGTGKTYTMAAMIREYVYQGYLCERINFDDFCVQVRSTMSPVSKQTEWDLIEPLKNVDKLFIDDLGLRSKQETDFAYVTLYSLLNKRQERRLPTIISSNKDLSRLEQAFDSRIASRLRTAAMIEMKGPDRRVTA